MSVKSIATEGSACVFGSMFIWAGVSHMKPNGDSSALDDSACLSYKASLTNRQLRTDTVNSSHSEENELKPENHEKSLK